LRLFQALGFLKPKNLKNLLLPGNESVPIRSAQCWPFPMQEYEYIFQMKYAEEILPNSTRKLLWFEITKMLIAV